MEQDHDQWRKEHLLADIRIYEREAQARTGQRAKLDRSGNSDANTIVVQGHSLLAPDWTENHEA